MDKVLWKPTIPLFLPRETLFYFTGAMIEAKTHASKNTLYFHSVVEIPRCLITRVIQWVLISTFLGI